MVHCLFDVLVFGVVVLGGVAGVAAGFCVLFEGGAEGGAKCIFIEKSIGLAAALTADIRSSAFRLHPSPLAPLKIPIILL